MFHEACMFAGCDWQEVERVRIPAYGSFSANMAPEPDGTVEYVYYRCPRCNRTTSEETLYSWRRNQPSGDNDA